MSHKETTVTLEIVGMMCPHCEATVRKTLEAFDRVESAEVSHEKGTAVVRFKGAPEGIEELKKAVEDKGYTVK